MELVGIIVATYNGEKFIREQIESLLNNSYKNIKIMVFDDGSTDNTIPIINEYAKNYPDKVFLNENKSNKGVAYNFLNALKKSDTKYTMFCDQDDVWKKDKIKNTLSEMLHMEKKYSNTIPIAVFTDAVVTDEFLQIKSVSFYEESHLNTKQLQLSHILMENKIIGCSTMVNEAVKEKLLKIPSNLRMHDWWIALICSAFGRISFLQEKTLFYRQHNKNVIGNQNFFSYVIGRVCSLKNQKLILIKTQNQAEEFYNIYKEELTDKTRKMIYEFSTLSNKNWFERRYKVMKYGFLKTGFIRNIGVMLIL